MVVRPVPVPDQVGYARSIAARGAAEHAQVSLVQRRIRIESLVKQGKHILVDMLFDVVLLLAFVLRRGAGNGRIHQCNKVRIHIAEQSGDAQRNVDARMANVFYWNRFHTDDL